MKFLTVAFCLIALALSTSFASETMKGMKKDYENFRQEMSAKLDATEKKIAELKADAKTKGNTVKEKTVQELEATRDQLKTELNETKAEGGSKWKSFKKSFAESIDRLNSKIQGAMQE